MATPAERHGTARPGLPPVVLANIVWNSVIAIGSLLLGRTVLELDEFYKLGDTVQYFVSAVALIPGVLALIDIVLLIRRRAVGRQIALALNYLGMVLSAVYLLHVWGVFIGFDDIAAALHKNREWLVGFALAYGVFWLAGRMPEESEWRGRAELGALGAAMLTVIALLWKSEAYRGFTHILSTYDTVPAWAATILIVTFGLLAYRMLLLGAYFGETPEQRIAWQGWLMLSPNIIGFMLFFAGPLLLSLYLSFTDSTGVKPPNWVGLHNYRTILSVEFKLQDDLSKRPQEALDYGYLALESLKLGDKRLVVGAKDLLFWQSLRNTILFCLLLVPLSIVPALALAILLNSKIPGMNFFRAVYFLPSVAAVVGTALIWRWLYSGDIGYFNYAILKVVRFINDILGTHIADPKIAWLTDQKTLLVSIVFLAAWQLIGFNTVLFLAGLQGVPRILYEAAYVDGAGRMGQFRYVTLPLLAPTTFFVVVTTVITGLQVFNEPYALISVRPLPTAATTSVYYLYWRGFFSFEFGYASSIAWVLFALIFVVTLVQFRISRGGAYD